MTKAPPAGCPSWDSLPLPHGGDRLETDQDQDGDGGLDEDEVEAVGGDDRACRCMVVEGFHPLVVLGDRAVVIVDREGRGQFRILDRFAVLVGANRIAVFRPSWSCIW